MKRLLLILILTFRFQTLTKADDIRDFEIEGMSIGDSLLDFFSEEEITIKNKKYHYSSKKYYQIRIDRNVSQYELVTVHLKDKDKKYIIHNIAGVIEYKNKDKKKCENQMETIKDSIVSNLKLSADFDGVLMFKHALIISPPITNSSANTSMLSTSLRSKARISSRRFTGKWSIINKG